MVKSRWMNLVSVVASSFTDCGVLILSARARRTQAALARQVNEMQCAETACCGGTQAQPTHLLPSLAFALKKNFRAVGFLWYATACLAVRPRKSRTPIPLSCHSANTSMYFFFRSAFAAYPSATQYATTAHTPRQGAPVRVPVFDVLPGFGKSGSRAQKLDDRRMTQLRDNFQLQFHLPEHLRESLPPSLSGIHTRIITRMSKLCVGHFAP